MAFELFKKKKAEEELPPIPEGSEGELPPLPPLPGEEEFEAPPAWPKESKPFPEPEAPPIPEMPAECAPYISPAPTMQMPAEKTTVFVRIDKYRDILRKIDEMQGKISELKTTLGRISAIKSNEAEIIDGWNAMLQEAKAKIDDVSVKLAKPETRIC